MTAPGRGDAVGAESVDTGGHAVALLPRDKIDHLRGDVADPRLLQIGKPCLVVDKARNKRDRDQERHQCTSMHLIDLYHAALLFNTSNFNTIFKSKNPCRRVGGRDNEPEIPTEDRDRRTVMCMQLAAKVGPRHLEEFFQKVGQVREVKMIADKNSRRSKGIAYVEFHDESSVMEVSCYKVALYNTATVMNLHSMC